MGYWPAFSRRFGAEYGDLIVSSVPAQLNWTHFVDLLPLNARIGRGIWSRLRGKEPAPGDPSKTTGEAKLVSAPRRIESKDPPTHQQGQFLAFIREYMLRNFHGAAPSHAAMQKFFNLTPPSVNSMLIRLESRGFIRRIPGQARAIELAISPDLIPPLDRPFKV